MAYNIRGKTLSTIIPQSLYNKYPNFITFLDKYYDFSRKSVIELNSSVGNINLSSKFYGMTSEFYVDREVTNTLDKSYTVDFDEKRTFLPSEDIVALRPLTSSLSFTLGIDREYVFDKISEPKLTFYYDQQYVIENNTGATVYIKDQQTAGSVNQYSTGVVIDGTTITITTTSTTPRLYYTVAGYSDIGIIDVEALPPAYTYVVENVINTGLPGTAGYTNSVYGFGNISNILFNPDYLIDNYNTITTVDAPDALFFKYLDSQGLGNLFSQTIVNRSSIDDFTRFLQAKGTANAVKFFFRSFFDQDVEIDYPGDDQLRASDGDFFIRQQMFIAATKPLELTRNRRLKGQVSGAYATIESQRFSAENDYYIVAIDKDKINGTFIINEKILVIDNTDSDIEYDIEGTLYGTVGGIEVIQPGLEYDRGETVTNTYTLEGVAREAIVSVDDIASSSIEHVDINTVLTHAAHTGAAFTVGETITQATTGATGVVRASTVDVTTVQNLNTGTWGTSNNVTGGTSSVTLSSSHLSAVASGGTNYAVGDRLLFPKPAEQVTFSATISPTQSFSFSGANNEYTFSSGVVSINITLEDDAKNAVLFTTDSNTYDLALVEINGINYTATDIVEGTPDVLTLPAVSANGLTIQSGQTIRVTIGADKIVDRFYDASFFDTSATVTTVDAIGYVSRVNESTGAIEEIQMSSGGSGYKKRPTTDILLPDASTKSIAVIPTDSHSLTHPSILANTNIITHPKFVSIRATQMITLNHDHMTNPFRAGVRDTISQATTLATGMIYSTITELTIAATFTIGEVITQTHSTAGFGGTGVVISSNGVKTLVEIFKQCVRATGVTGSSTTFTGSTSAVVASATAFSTLQTNIILSTGTFNTSANVVDSTSVAGDVIRTLAAADINSIHGQTSHFIPDEEVRGVTSGATGRALNKTVQVTHGSQSDFAAGDKLTGGTSGATGIIAVNTSATVNQISQSVNSNRFATGSPGLTTGEVVSNNVTNLTHGGASSGAFTAGNTMSKGTARGIITEVVDSTHVKVRVSVGTFTTGTITEEETSKTATASNIGAFSTATTSGKMYPDAGMHLNLIDVSGTFVAGEELIGVTSGASASVCFDLLYADIHNELTGVAGGTTAFVVGEVINQATTSAAGVVTGIYGTAATTADATGARITYTTTSGTFSGQNTVTGASGATIGASGGVTLDYTTAYDDSTVIKGETSGAQALIIENDITLQGSYVGAILAEHKLVCTNLFTMSKQFQAGEDTTDFVGYADTPLLAIRTNTMSQFNGSPNDDTSIVDTIRGLSSSAVSSILDYNNANTTDTTTTVDLSSGAYTVGETIINSTGRLATTISSIKSSFDVGETVKQETVTLTHATTGGAFVVGRTLTGQTSGATGRIKTETSNTITVLTNVIGTFVVSEDISQSVDDKTVAITASGVGATNTIATGLITSTNDTRTVITNKTGTFNTSDILSGASSKMVATPSAVNGGADADLSVFGEDFGGIIQASLTNNIIGITRNHEVILTRSDVADITGENANINLLSGYYNDYGKEFKSVAGNSSESLIKITDSYKYQDFSYVIKTSLSYSAFSNLFKKLAHPAGMIFFNDFLLVNSFQQKLNKGVATATKEIRINIHKTSVTKLSHSEQTFTKGRKITGGTSGATGKVAIAHHKLLTTLDVVRGTFVAGETLTEEVSSNTATTSPVVLTHPDHGAAAFTVGGTISQVTSNASGTVSVASTDSTSIVDLALGTWGTVTNVVAARTLTHSNHDKDAFTVGETLTQTSTSATGYVVSSTVDATIFRDLGGGTWGTSNNVTGGTSSIVLTAGNLSAVSAAGVTLTAANLTKATVTSGINDIDKLHLIFSASSLSAIRDFFINYHAQRPFDDQFQWLNESLVSFSNYISSGSDAYNNSNLISTYVDVPINEKSIVKRDGVRGIPFENFRQTENVKTVTGTGTVGFADTSTVAANGPPGPVITVTGGSSDFINQCSPRDIITAGAHTLLVVAVASDTSLTAQRTSAAGSTGTVSGQAYTIAQKRINELNNATFDDLIQHGYAMTIQDVNRQFLSGSELTMDQFKDVFAV